MTLEEAREFFAADRFATYKTGITIDEVGKDYARCSFVATENDVAAHGGVMGGAIFTLADFTFAVATNTKEQLTVTTSSTINFVSMPKDRKLTGESRCLKNGKRACFFEITITDGAGNLVATVLSNGVHL
ncbi:MAG: PaaI family thioesterase [Clostridia bacterium]|nr:PaaI family thioesterase [Clostridia bacterium]